MRQVGDRLCKVRGAASTVMLSGLKPSATASEILQLAVEKHCASDSRLQRTQYILLYHDQQQVEFLPGGQEPFTLEGYRQFMGRSYSKLVLFICPAEDYECGLLLCLTLTTLCFVQNNSNWICFTTAKLCIQNDFYFMFIMLLMPKHIQKMYKNTDDIQTQITICAN